jgi:hypothetical protein
MEKVLVLANKPTLAQLASACFIEREIGVDKVLAIYSKSGAKTLEVRPNCKYFVFGKIDNIIGNTENIVFLTPQNINSTPEINLDVLTFDNTVEYIISTTRDESENEIGLNLIEIFVFIADFIRKIIFNLSSEYSYLKLLYYLHSEETTKPIDFVNKMFEEFDKLVRIGQLLYKAKEKFESNPLNKIEKIRNYLVAVYVGQNDPFVYRYLFENVDIIVYINKEKKRAGLLFNKRVNRTVIEKIINDFVKTFEPDAKRLDFTAYKIYNPESEDVKNVASKILKFLAVEL